MSAERRKAGSVPNRRGVWVEMPPLVKTFDLPSRDDLLDVVKGDYAKLVFRGASGYGERMWVKVVRRSADEWVGVLNNTQTLLRMKIGDRVLFHPLAVISIDAHRFSRLREDF